MKKLLITLFLMSISFTHAKEDYVQTDLFLHWLTGPVATEKTLSSGGMIEMFETTNFFNPKGFLTKSVTTMFNEKGRNTDSGFYYYSDYIDNKRYQYFSKIELPIDYDLKDYSELISEEQEWIDDNTLKTTFKTGNSHIQKYDEYGLLKFDFPTYKTIYVNSEEEAQALLPLPEQTEVIVILEKVPTTFAFPDHKQRIHYQIRAKDLHNNWITNFMIDPVSKVKSIPIVRTMTYYSE